MAMPLLFSTDVRNLACRVDADPRAAGCHKERVAVAERSLWLCPRRVAFFLSDKSGSMAGVSCVQPSLFE